jgi:hypothetical protein
MQSRWWFRGRIILLVCIVSLLFVASLHQLSKMDFLDRLGVVPVIGRYGPFRGPVALNRVHSKTGNDLLDRPCPC